MKVGSDNRKLIALLVLLAFIASAIFILLTTALALNWGGAGDPSGSGSDVLGVAHDGTNLYAGCSNGSVYYNSNPTGGGDWYPLPNPDPSGTPVLSLAHDGTNLYAGCLDGGVYYNSNPTEVSGTWIHAGEPSSSAARVMGLAHDGTTLYAGCSNGEVYYAMSPGAWLPVGDVGGVGGTLDSLAHDGTNLYVSGSFGIRYNPNPTGWGTWSTPLWPPGAEIWSITHDGNNLYASSDDFHIYYNTDPTGEGAWTSGGDPLGGWTYGLCHDGTNLYAGCEHGVYWSKSTFAVSASVSGGNGTADPSSQSVSVGQSASVNIAPNTSYRINTITDNGSNVTNPTSRYIINNIQGDHNVVGKFASNVPTVTLISPSSMTAGSPGFTLTVDGTDFISGSKVRWNGSDRKTTYVSATKLTAQIPASDIKNVGSSQVTVFNPAPGGGTSNAKNFTINEPLTINTFYFAEGYTGENFQEYLCIGNLGGAAVDADVTYMFPDGTTQNETYTVSPNSRYTVDVNGEVGTGREVSIEVTSESPDLVAERPLYFNYEGSSMPGGSDVVGAGAPAKKWYFAEGTTLPEFNEYITVLNPGGTAANLTFRYMVEGAGEEIHTGTVGSISRSTFKARDHVGDNKNISLLVESDQDVVVERPTYFNYQGLADRGWTGGHCVMGVNAPADTWSFAEGTTRDNAIDGAFEEWVCIQNPGDDAINVNAVYQLAGGQGAPVDKSYNVPGKERRTISVNRELGPEKDASIKLTSDSDFIAERTLYFDYHNIYPGGHDVMGANANADTWFFAEGYTGSNFEEWLCIQNSGDTNANLTITYYPEGGADPITTKHTVTANTRLTIDVNTDAGANMSISARVVSDQPVIVERPIYFNFNGVWPGGHDVMGY